MTLYYIYKVVNGDDVANAFVSDPQLFALKQFDPSKMEFMGISVEAEDPQSANQIYKLQNAGEIFSCEEPTPTLKKRRIFEEKIKLLNGALSNSIDKAQKALNKLTLAALSLEVATTFHELNIQMSELARQLRESTTEHPELSSEDLYRRLKEHYIDEFRILHYRDKPSSTD